MAYTPATLDYIYGGPVEGTLKLWAYRTTDTLQAVLAANYITDVTTVSVGGLAVGNKHLMSVGDVVIVSNQQAPYGLLCQVTAISATGATLSPFASDAGGLALPRNLLDGGDFTTNPWQRGTSFTAIANTLTYTADRWWAVGGASSSISVSQQPQTAVAGFSQALQFQRANSNSNTAPINLGQTVETADSIRLQGKPFTLSFWAAAGANWSPAGGNLNVTVETGTGTNQSAANEVAGTWTGYQPLVLTPQQGSAVPAAGIAQPITSSWTRYAFSGVMPANETQIGVRFSATPVGTAGASDFVQIMGVQLEEGGEASDFEHLDVQMVLEICQRYFFQANEPAAGVVLAAGMITGASSIVYEMNLPVQMRAAPTVTVSAGTFKANIAGTATATTISAGSTHTPNYLTINATGSTLTAGQASLLQGGGGSGFVQASADL